MFRLSRFSELLKHFPRGAFDRSVQRLQADKHCKGFSCWQHLVTMLYAQLSGASSLRTLERGFNAHQAHHYHLGCRQVRRSTLAEANAKGRVEVFTEMANGLMHQLRGTMQAEGKALLHLLDSTSITLKGPGFDAWASAKRTRHTQGLKLHVLYGLSECTPLAQGITAPNVNDIEYGRTLAVQRGVTYVFDKAYCDYSWWWQMQQSGARFVTRFKRNARLQIVQTRAIPNSARGIILKDQRVVLSNKNPGAGRMNPYTGELRRIEVARPGEEPLVLATNDLRSSAQRIAEHYRARWQIELFFKWIKQHLRIKRFLGRSEHAVRIQILTALIAYLLVSLQFKAQRPKGSTLWMYLAELQATLFQRPDLERHRHRHWRERRRSMHLNQGTLFA